MAENNRQLSLSWQVFMEGLAEISLMFELANGSFSIWAGMLDQKHRLRSCCLLDPGATRSGARIRRHAHAVFISKGGNGDPGLCQSALAATIRAPDLSAMLPENGHRLTQSGHQPATQEYRP